MSHVACLIAAPRGPRLRREDCDQASGIIQSAGGKLMSTAWLSKDEACDFFFENADPLALRNELESQLADRKIDIACLPASGRKKQLFVADMDSTIITVECIDELADFAGIKPQVAAITEAAMRGEIDFTRALKQRVALLKGLAVETLTQCYNERVKITPGAKTLVATMRSHGVITALVSGGFTFFTTQVAAGVGFHQDRANKLEVRDGKLTGEILPPISDASTKLATLEELCVQHRIAPHLTLAAGDGANDIPMLQAAGMSVAYHGKPKAMAAAQMRIRHGDLTALLFAQGYTRAEFKTAL